MTARILNYDQGQQGGIKETTKKKRLSVKKRKAGHPKWIVCCLFVQAPVTPQKNKELVSLLDCNHGTKHNKPATRNGLLRNLTWICQHERKAQTEKDRKEVGVEANTSDLGADQE